MFINCPYCKALVATDPATDLPPEHCPRCAAKLREAPAETAAVVLPVATPGQHAGGAQAPAPGNLLETPAPDPATRDAEAAASPPSALSSQIHHIIAGEPAAEPSPTPAVAPIATLLKPAAPAAAAEAGPAPQASATATASPPPAAPVAPAAPVTPDQGHLAAPAQAAPGSAVAATEVATSRPSVPPAATPIVSTDAAAAPDARAGTAAGAAPASAAPAAAPAPAPVIASGIDDAGPASAGVATGRGQAGAVAAPSAAATATPPARSLPSFARRHAGARRSGFHWKTAAVVAALALLLLLQLLLADRARLAADARWRPLVSTLCGALGCSLPPWHEPAAFTVLARDVRPHPVTPGALRVTATFRNDARWPQPWPRLRLTLSDVDGRTVAARDFAAADYLGAAPTQAELHSGQSASIAMDLVEPARRSVAFDFELH